MGRGIEFSGYSGRISPERPQHITSDLPDGSEIWTGFPGDGRHPQPGKLLTKSIRVRHQEPRFGAILVPCHVVKGSGGLGLHKGSNIWARTSDLCEPRGLRGLVSSRRNPPQGEPHIEQEDFSGIPDSGWEY